MREHRKKEKNVIIASVLALVPGLSLVYIGRVKKAILLFIIDLGILTAVLFSDSYLMILLAINIYVFTFFAPFVESYQVAKYGRNTLGADSRWYVVVLLLTTGFNALPLLWSSGNFSRKAKIAWSVAVPVLAAIFFLFLVNYWGQLEEVLKTFAENSG